MKMRKPTITNGPASHYAGTDERIVEISDNNGAGIGALMSVQYRPDGPLAGLRIHIYRQDPSVTVMVEGHRVTPMSNRERA